MTQLKKRIEQLEQTKPSTEATSCLVFVHPGEDAEQKRREALANFMAEHKREPDVLTVVVFVEPAPVSEDD